MKVLKSEEAEAKKKQKKERKILGMEIERDIGGGGGGDSETERGVLSAKFYGLSNFNKEGKWLTDVVVDLTSRASSPWFQFKE